MSNYFIVVGRMDGDDEASAFVVEATNDAEAVEAFHAAILGDEYEIDGDDLPDDGPGAVYIDHIFNCGSHKPEGGKSFP